MEALFDLVSRIGKLDCGDSYRVSRGYEADLLGKNASTSAGGASSYGIYLRPEATLYPRTLWDSVSGASKGIRPTQSALAPHILYHKLGGPIPETLNPKP